MRIDVDVPHATRGIVLHGRGLTVRSATIAPAGASPIAAQSSLRAAVGGRGAPEELVLTATQPIAAGHATIEIVFDREFDPGLQGLYRVHVGDDWYAFTQMEPNDARRAFPCFDEPGFKVPWDLALTVPSGLVTVANMPEASRQEDPAHHRVTVRFATTPNTPSYLIAFAAGPFDVVQGATAPVPIRAITTRGQGRLTRDILAAAADHVRILGEYFDRPFPYPKLDLLAVPEFGAGAMENPGLITFREELMLLDPDHASVQSQRTLAAVLAHELAHHWFGDLVTMRWWNDLWLNEGFATWMQARVVDSWRPDSGGRIDGVRSAGSAMQLDSLPAARAVRQPVRTTSEAMEAFDGITYAKGAAVLRMIELWIGEEAFRTGVRAYIHAHEWGNATAQDLFDALSAASHEDVTAVAATFLDRPGVPAIQIDLACTGGAPRAVITQSAYRVPSSSSSSSPPPAAAFTPWRVPVCFGFEQNGRRVRQCTLLTETTATVPLEHATRCPRWIDPNDQQAGYYRYEITPQVQALATPATLRSLDVIGRIGLVDDAWSMVRAGRLPVDRFLALLRGFVGERDRAVVETMLGSIREIYGSYVEERDRAIFGAWIVALLTPVATELGWDARRGESPDRTLMRRSVLTTLGLFGDDRRTVAEAERRTRAYLADPHAVDPDVAATAVPIASRHAGADRFTALTNLLAHPPTPTDRTIALSGLANFGDATVLRQSLDLSLTPAVRLQDALRLVYSAWSHPMRRVAVTGWVHEHFDGLRARLPGEAIGYLGGIVSGACTAEELSAERTFFEPRLAHVEGATRGLQEAVDTAEQCIAFRAREGARLHQYLAH